MKLIVDSRENCARLAADQFEALLKNKPNAVLGLATGATPEMLYAELLRRYRQGLLNFWDVQAFHLDEYVGLAPSCPQSYAYYMHQKLFDQVNFQPKNLHCHNGQEVNKQTAANYDVLIQDCGGIDLQLLGLGENGHIGFNEPGTPWESVTHIVDLTESTRWANKVNFPSLGDVPWQAVSMGIVSIMNAREIVLLAFGPRKALAVKDMVAGKITNDAPASILQLHPNVTVYVDKEAAALL